MSVDDDTGESCEQAVERSIRGRNSVGWSGMRWAAENWVTKLSHEAVRKKLARLARQHGEDFRG